MSVRESLGAALCCVAASAIATSQQAEGARLHVLARDRAEAYVARCNALDHTHFGQAIANEDAAE